MCVFVEQLAQCSIYIFFLYFQLFTNFLKILLSGTVKDPQTPWYTKIPLSIIIIDAQEKK